jgi:hypothetical protein
MRNFVSADKAYWDLSAEQKLILFQTQKCDFVLVLSMRAGEPHLDFITGRLVAQKGT